MCMRYDGKCPHCGHDKNSWFERFMSGFVWFVACYVLIGLAAGG